MSWWNRRRQRRQEPSLAGAGTAPEAHVIEIEQHPAPADPWRPLAGEFGLRLLTLMWEAVHHVGQAEESEQDPHRRALLFRIDHTITRARRLAENLRVLAGESVEDPDRQTTALHDIARAAGASAEHYERLRFGPIADLAVTADAADDVIRVLTELIDNADRYSPPDQPVTVAAHLTADGDVLMRVEDAGIGVPEDRLEALNQLLSNQDELREADLQPSRVGIPVIAVLTRQHPGLRAWLTPRSAGGTVAMLRIGAQLLSEIPFGRPPVVAPRHAHQVMPPAAAPVPGVNGTAVTGSTPPPALDPDSTAILPTPGRPRMPRRTPASIRGVDQPAPDVPAASYTTPWHDDAEAFNAGVEAARRDGLTSLRKGPGA